VPILWDRWTLANPFAKRLVLADLVAAVGPRTALILDLKGRDPKLSAGVLAAVEPRLEAGAETTVCARHWPLFEPFRGTEGIRLVYSVGSARELRRLRRRLRGDRIEAITIHERLLDAASARELLELADVIMTWPINTLERAQELVHWGVEGLISDRPGLVQPAVGGEQ
jgi:hypothetical protein